MTFKIIDTRRKIDDGKFYCHNYIFALFLILPTVLLALIIFDLIFMIINFIVYASMFVLLMTPMRRRFHEWHEDLLNKMYKGLVGMTAMDVQGFKSQRTILQLHLESLPQIAFQLYLLFRIRDLKEKGRVFAVEVDEESIIVSLACACLHVVLELANLWLES